jgi:hypothetical protein
VDLGGWKGTIGNGGFFWELILEKP